VRFEDLEGRVRLPIESVRDRFRYEVVLTVLPVRAGRHGTRDVLLVAMESMLAIVTPIRFPGGSWMTQFSPWHVVTLVPAVTLEDGHTKVSVGRRTFDAPLDSEFGRRALGDFLAVIEARQTTRIDAGSP
jgi:hypothetical protein